jgi:hypothetical protein
MFMLLFIYAHSKGGSRMIFTSVRSKKNKIEVIVMKNDDLLRKVILAENKEYIIDPINPRTKKNRGKKVIFKGVTDNPSEKFRDNPNTGHLIEHFDKNYVAQAKVYYTDTQRIGKVDFSDLDYLDT